MTPALRATVTDPVAQPLRAEFEVEHDPAATGQIWTGAVDNVASGTQASIAVPAGELADGWKVRWRLRAVAGDIASTWSDWRQVTVDVTQPGEEPLARTAGPVIRTDESFTAAAWLRWSDKDGDYTVLEQKGTHQAPFRLGYTPDHGLVFTFTSAEPKGVPGLHLPTEESHAPRRSRHACPTPRRGCAPSAPRRRSAHPRAAGTRAARRPRRLRRSLRGLPSGHPVGLRPHA